MRTDGNKPAFAAMAVDSNELFQELGLTKREYFAAMAMQGLMSATDSNGDWKFCIESASEYSVQAADALIKKLNKESNE